MSDQRAAARLGLAPDDGLAVLVGAVGRVHREHDVHALGGQDLGAVEGAATLDRREVARHIVRRRPHEAIRIRRISIVRPGPESPERKRNGPGHADLRDWRDVFVESPGPHVYDRPTVVLTSGGTFSAAETFTLAMREQPHVTVVGEDAMLEAALALLVEP